MSNNKSLTLTKILAIIYIYKRKYPQYKQLYTKSIIAIKVVSIIIIIIIITIITIIIIIIIIIIIMIIIITIIPETRKPSPKPGNTGLMSRGG